MATGFHIERQRHEQRWELRLHGIFDGTSAWELRRAMLRLGRHRPIHVDFSDVTELHEFGAAVLSAGFLARRWPPIRFVGLRPGDRSVMRRHGVDLEPASAPPMHPIFGLLAPI